MNLGNAQVAIPIEKVREGLKRGKVSFTWKAIRSWIRPTPLPTVSAHDNGILDLPLKVITPAFLAFKNTISSAPQQRVAVDENIPNLFFGFPQPEAASTGNDAPESALAHAVTKPVETNYYSLSECETSEAGVDREPSLETTFITRCATPNEVVSRAAALDRVAGALVALPDGLMVASKLSSDLNGDTLAAFLPQIFGKISQCTKELRMGELNNLSFTVGNVPWKIFRVNAIYFAAFGRTGQGLPTAELAALAAELDHKKQ